MKKQWWHDKVAYQIYPKSFCDSNGDGIGDLQGIISKLDYLKNLGIDIIWLSPIYKTPFIDEGYDIADYYSIDPLFGTMEDMEELLVETKKRDMYVLMDLVVNHCSSEHEWFKKAMEDPGGTYGNYFIIKDGTKEPNNWRSYFGGSVWEKIPNHDKYYLHLFAKAQPDLNWENEEVIDEIYKNINWWLEKGLSGFRIDAIVNIKKDPSYGNLPVDGPDGLGDVRHMLPKAKGLMEALKDMKEKTFDRYGAFALAELFDYNQEELKDFIGEEGCFSSIFDFSTDLIGKSGKGWYDNKEVSPKEYRDTIFNSHKVSDGIGYMANIIENHDEPRGVSRYIPKEYLNDTSKKLLATILMMRKGLPFLFQGQEIGMTNCKWNSIDEIDDIASIDQYHVALQAGCTEEKALEIMGEFSRDNARTPMQWSDCHEAGFTTGKPWLKVNPNYVDINVQSQEKKEGSVLSHYKHLIALRKHPKYQDVIVYGDFIPAYENTEELFAFYRKNDEKTLLTIANMSGNIGTVNVKEKIKAVLSNNIEQLEQEGGQVTLKPYQAVVLELE